MFLKNYIDDTYFEEVINTYNYEYLNSLNEEKFKKIYNLLKKYNFYFIEDIILKYIEIFEMDSNELEIKINHLKNKLGENFVSIIGNNLTYLNEIIDNSKI